MHFNTPTPLRPAQFAEQQLVKAILDGRLAPGAALPNERTLARQLGVTRPTLREILQRLSAEGWLKIRHGKPTRVQDYWRSGGLRLLGTLSKHARQMPPGFVEHLLEIRAVLLPEIARLSIARDSQAIMGRLGRHPQAEDDAAVFTDFDWHLQLLMSDKSGNPLFYMILNDFKPLYRQLGLRYFSLAEGRQASLRYYRKLYRSIETGDGRAVQIVRRAMQHSITIWQRVAPKTSVFK